MDDPTATAIVSHQYEALHMSPVAAWICIAILAWLIITSILVLVFKNRYFSPLLRSVDTVADVAIMVANSERYLKLARKKGASGLRADKSFRTRLGWYRTKDGHINWGLELADDDEIEFLSKEEVESLAKETSD
jgi:hypothetical protein